MTIPVMPPRQRRLDTVTVDCLVTRMGPSRHQRRELERIRARWPETPVVARLDDGAVVVQVGVIGRNVVIPLAPRGPMRVGAWWGGHALGRSVTLDDETVHRLVGTGAE